MLRGLCRIFILIFLIHLTLPSLAGFREDTATINKQLLLIDKLLESNADSALIEIHNVYNNSHNLRYAYGFARTNAQLIRYYMLKGLNDSAVYYAADAIKFARISKDTNLIINVCLAAAKANSSATNKEKAIELCLMAQRFADYKKNNKLKIRIAHDLGFIYSKMELHIKAISYFKEGLKLSETEKDTFHFANISARLGGEFNTIQQYDSALKYNKKSLAFFSFIKHKRGIGVSLVNQASTYKGLKQYDKAIETAHEAIKVRTELGDGYAITIMKNLLASCYTKKKEFKKALETALEGEKLCKEQNDLPLTLDNYGQLYIIYHYLDNYKKAFEYARKYINLSDSINLNTNVKSLTELQTKYETDKKEKEIALLQLEKINEQEKTKAENLRRNIILSAVIVIALLVLVFSIVLYKRFKESNQQRIVIEKQKQLVDQKNKEIIDSINYALTIQEAIIPEEKELKKHTKDSFVIFRPKDIVSGDFYWISSVASNNLSGNCFFIAVADCTGHGVPGAFMSMMGISFLNEIVNEKKIHDTKKILTLLREKVIGNLNKSHESKDKRDGMDMVIMRIDLGRMEMMFSGANNSIYHLSGNCLNELKGDKIPVGLYHEELKSYTEKIIKIKTGDRIFATTDGLPDQFGGPKGKKFMYRKFESILPAPCSIPEMKMQIEKEFENWKGNNEQIDDITVIGIEI